MVRHKKFGPAQNILRPVKGQGISKSWAERGISIDADFGPCRYVLTNFNAVIRSSRSNHQLLTFIQVGYSNIVLPFLLNLYIVAVWFDVSCDDYND